MYAGKIIPIRFLGIIAHLVILMTILWSRRPNVLACLPVQYSPSEYDAKDQQLTIGLSTGIGATVFELVSFVLGASMFSPGVAMLSVVAHVGASISLALFVLNSWDCDLYWYIFAFCSGIPVLVEFVLFAVFLQRMLQSRPRVT